MELEQKNEYKLNSKFMELEQKNEYKLNSKLLWLELKYEEKIEELEEKYEEKINNKLIELEEKYEEKINNKLIELEQKYEEKIEELEGKYEELQEKYEEIEELEEKYEEKIEELEGKYEELQEKYEEKIEELKEQYKEKNTIKLIELEKKYEHKLKDLQQMLNSKINYISVNCAKINDIKNNMVTQGDLDDMSFHCSQINPNIKASSDYARNSNHKFNPYYASIFMKCYQCVYDNNLCYSCRQHIKNISSIKLKNKNYMLIHSSMCGCLGDMNVNVIRINKQYYWLDIDNLILFNYTPISALEFHNNIQGIDVRVNTNKKYEKMICEDNTSRYFGFWDDVLPIIYEVGRIDKLTKKVTFHNYN